MSALTDRLLDIVYPTRCILCREFMPPGRPGICAACQSVMPQAVGESVHGNYFSECVSALYYEGAVKEAILRFKFEGAQAYSAAFGELVAARIYEELDGRYDTLSWAPISWDRRRRRGYDQARLIAQNAADRLRRPLVPLLKKRFGVPAQALTDSAEQRRQNIAGAYRVIAPSAAEGKRVLLIDDIVTTGATLSECAKTLLLAGAEEVMCATLAMTR